MKEALDDFEDFLTSTEGVKIRDDFNKFLDQTEAPVAIQKEDVAPGAVCQYSLYLTGYMPTTATVKYLPSGIYDVRVGQHGVYADPLNIKDGLLLELPEMRSEHVLQLVEKFWESEKDYKHGNEYVNGGAIFKVGVMLYGPPGSGKSCTIKLLMKKIVKNGGTVFLGNSVHPNDLSKFLKVFSEIEPNRKIIVVLEDFDSLTQRFKEDDYLQLLDGTMSIDNVLFIATTNYPEKLDPRIYNRPGRFTHVIKVGLPTKEARTAYLKAILKKHDDVEYIVRNTENFSIDHLSALVNAAYREKKNLPDEIERLRKLFKVPKADENGPMGLNKI